MSPLDELLGIVARLRGEGGCPWDRAQTHESLRPYLLEETYEVLDAIDSGDRGALRKELGDLLFQIVLLAQMAKDAGEFSFDDVARDISDKMVRRHPHVFEPGHQNTQADGDVSAWEERKAQERGHRGSALDGVPKTLPALLRAHRITEKASRVGFDWPDTTGVRTKLDEEVAELDEALASGEPSAITHEFGDVLFTLVNMGRFLPTGSEEALRGATHRFEARFREIERRLAAEGASVHTAPLERLEQAWNDAKEVVG